MSRNAKIATLLGALLLVVVIAVAIVAWPKKAQARPPEKKDDVPDPGLDEDEIDEPIDDDDDVSIRDPWRPTPEPVKGAYYAIERGDNMLSILSRAGFRRPELYDAYLTMLEHPENAWIGTEERSGEEPYATVLRFNKRFAPGTGNEHKPYAHSTRYLPQSQWGAGRWPVVWVPATSQG